MGPLFLYTFTWHRYRVKYMGKSDGFTETLSMTSCNNVISSHHEVSRCIVPQLFVVWKCSKSPYFRVAATNKRDYNCPRSLKSDFGYKLKNGQLTPVKLETAAASKSNFISVFIPV